MTGWVTTLLPSLVQNIVIFPIFLINFLLSSDNRLCYNFRTKFGTKYCKFSSFLKLLFKYGTEEYFLNLEKKILIKSPLITGWVTIFVPSLVPNSTIFLLFSPLS